MAHANKECHCAAFKDPALDSPRYWGRLVTYYGNTMLCSHLWKRWYCPVIVAHCPIWPQFKCQFQSHLTNCIHREPSTSSIVLPPPSSYITLFLLFSTRSNPTPSRPLFSFSFTSSQVCTSQSPTSIKKDDAVPLQDNCASCQLVGVWPDHDALDRWTLTNTPRCLPGWDLFGW